MRGRAIFEFGEFRVDLGHMAATRAGAPVPLEPKAFDVLVHLIEHRDRLVTKDELLDAVWAGTFVTPNVLTRAVTQIRKALGDDAGDAHYVETAAKRGYRFIAPVTVVAAPLLEGAELPPLGAAPSAPVPVPPARAPRRSAIVVAAVTSWPP